MSSMTDETYQGSANRETWAFNLHWQNDQGLYNETLDVARRTLALVDREPGDPAVTDGELGQEVVNYWRNTIDGWLDEDQTRRGLPDALRMFDREVGSWWRVDVWEVGAAVRESLDNES